jgi:hypothetical protein
MCMGSRGPPHTHTYTYIHTYTHTHTHTHTYTHTHKGGVGLRMGSRGPPPARQARFSLAAQRQSSPALLPLHEAHACLFYRHHSTVVRSAAVRRDQYILGIHAWSSAHLCAWRAEGALESAWDRVGCHCDW